MNKVLRVLAGLAILVMVFSTTSCNKLLARDQLNKGVQSYKNARFEEAIGHFQQAVEKDPTLINARLYLATAYAQMVVPGVSSPENDHNVSAAIDEYKKVLEAEPKNLGARPCWSLSGTSTTAGCVATPPQRSAPSATRAPFRI